VGNPLLILPAAVATLALVACAGSDGAGSEVVPSHLTPTPGPTEVRPTPTAEPIPTPPQVLSIAAELGWDGFLSGKIEFSFDNPDAAAFAVECFSDPSGILVGQAEMGADGSGALEFGRDYVAELAEPSEGTLQTLNCVPDNGLPPVVLRFRVRGPDGLAEQLQRQPPISDAGLAFIVVYQRAEARGMQLILQARLSATGEAGSLDCSATPAGSPTTYLFGDVKPFGADNAVVEFHLPDVEASLGDIAPGADIEFLCNVYGPDDTSPGDSRTLRLTPPLR